jgi:thymidine phosphorylase
MRAVDVIRKKRDGQSLESAEIDAFVAGAMSGEWADYQVAALLMAIVLRGMTAAETSQLTTAMTGSGVRLDLSDIPGPKVDKHSTGGVGDKTTLVIAPLATACGVVVPKVSGRGLGHSGGTLDKLEAIPGFRADLSLDEFRAALTRVGCDVTATVESIPLIAASVMSKKLAEGLDALVLDVKVGRGAFMKNLLNARRLAEALVRIGEDSDVRTWAMLTAMDQPLGNAVGNALELIEAIETLKGRGPEDLTSLSVSLAAGMVHMGYRITWDEAVERVKKALASGKGFEKFRDIVAQQGGDPRVLDDYRLLPTAPHRMVVRAPRPGYVTSIDAELVGRATVVLGAGRSRVEDIVDHAVGVMLRVKEGECVRSGAELVELHYGLGSRLEEALRLLAQAFAIEGAPRPLQPLILGTTGTT